MPVIALPDVAIVAYAVLAMLLLFATVLLVKLLANLLGRLPVVGGWAGSHLESLAGWAELQIHNVLDSALHALSATFYAVARFSRWIFGQVTNAFIEVVGAAIRTADHLVPEVRDLALRTAASVLAKAESGITAARRDLAAAVTGAEQAAARGVAAAETDAARLAVAAEQAAGGYARQLVSAAERSAAQGIALTDQAVRALHAQAERDIAAAEAAATQLAHALHVQAERDIGHAMRAAEAFAVTEAGKAASMAERAAAAGAASVTAAAWPGITTDIDALRQALGADFPALRDAVSAIPSAAADSVPAAISAAMAMAVPALRFMTECGVPNCRNLGGLGQFLSSLFADATAAALIAFLIEAVTDPGQFAHDAQQLLGGLAGDGVTAARDLLKVA